MHFLGDFTKLSTASMLSAKSSLTSFTQFDKIFKIGLHGSVHAILQTFVFMFFVESLWFTPLVFLLHLVLHTAIDIAKPLTTIQLKKFNIDATNSSNVWFWVVFGLDQYAHAITIISCAYIFK